MSESDRSSVGLFAFPISDPPLKFHNFLFDYGHELGRASGDIFHWRPIGDSAQCDEAYRMARTSALEKRDQEDSVAFKQDIKRLGSEEWFCQGEYQKYARELGVENIEPPFVVFTAKPLREKAILKFEPVLFDKQEWARKLATVFTKNLTAQAFSNLRKDEIFTDKTIESVQRYLWKVGLDIFKIDNLKARILPERLRLSTISSLKNTPIEPHQDTILRWWWRKDGSIAINTETKGKPNGKIEFSLNGGFATKQQNLMLLLIENHPNEIPLSKVINDIYPDDRVTSIKTLKELREPINRVRSLVNAIRDKLEKNGSPPNIIPAVNMDSGLNYNMKLNVFKIYEA